MSNKQLSLYFNNIQIPSFIKITNVKEDIIPSLNATKDETKFEDRKITIDFVIRRNKFIKDSERAELINFIKGDNWKPSTLILNNKIYKAKVTNFEALSGSIRKGEGSIVFTSFDGYLLKNEYENKVVLINKNQNYNILNEGDFDIYPKFKINILSYCTKIKIIDSHGNYLELNGIFNANDVIQIEQEHFKVTNNGNLAMSLLHLKSKRIKLKTQEQLSIKFTDGNASIDMIYIPKFL
ncbi:MAG: phage tail family protein [Bacilli bacterium]|nr:phage tail family protein [Bacilli bacterium]